ncbi:MAG: GNAT family N-acetyltransferase [Gammaproteobacteria bacterium]|nr:GNAT family N-acetyltransferase [Gammaproteobacteria bacterium]
MIFEPLRAHPQHLDTLAAWHFAEWHSLYPDHSLDDFARDLQDSMGVDFIPGTWALLDGEQLIGSASILHQDMTANTDLSPWLANVYIAAKYRGRGLGQYLVLALMKKAAQAGLQNLYLFTEDRASFYHKLGWQVIRQHSYNQAEVRIMTTDLQP